MLVSAGLLRYDELRGWPHGGFTFKARTTIAPLESHRFARAGTTEGILADPLPAGTCSLTVGVEFVEHFTGRPEIPVGEFHPGLIVAIANRCVYVGDIKEVCP